MRHPIHILPALCLTAALAAASCTETVDRSAQYVFTERTIADYLSDHAQFSEYVALMKEQPVSRLSATTVYQLMTAYGAYTCFAPTNEAIRCYLDTLAAQGVVPTADWAQLPSGRLRDSLRAVIVLNSILDGTALDKSFVVGAFPQNNEEFSINTMADRKISVTFPDNNPEDCAIDGRCRVSPTNRDIETINGYIHEVDHVVSPSNETLGGTMHRYATDFGSGLSVMGRLIDACGLTDTLSAVKDEVYEELMQSGKLSDIYDNPGCHFRNIPIPTHRKYGFTLFALTDDFWSTQLHKEPRDITVEDVKAWVVAQGYYPDALDNGNYGSEDNVLNQFVTYHLLPMRLPADKLVIHYNEKGYSPFGSRRPSVPVWAHYTTMGKRRLLRLWESAESGGVCLNRFPRLDNGRHGTYHETGCDAENEGVRLNTENDAKVVKLINAVIYPIDKPLAYDAHTRHELKKVRLRYDAWDFTPEIMNNDLRHAGYEFQRYFYPDEVYPYFENIWVNSRDTWFIMLSGWKCNWPNYQADEVCTEGLYDCTWLVPPVPESGVYEIRMGVSTYSSWRGICQIYFGTDRENLQPEGIPVDMALGGLYRRIDNNTYHSIVNWEEDIDDDDYNAQVDKRMRNNGFMKGPEYIVQTPGGTDTNRSLEKSTRRILLRRQMDADKKYYLRFKTVQDRPSRQLFIDYLEWCPKEVYDNPEDPEDIW